MRTSVFIALILAFAVPMPASAYLSDVVFNNPTTKCAWVTLYAAGPLSPWEIVHRDNNRPRWVKPGESYTFVMGPPFTHEVKIRAEVKANADCTGHNIADTYDIRKGLYDQTKDIHLVSELFFHSGNRYNLWFK